MPSKADFEAALLQLRQIEEEKKSNTACAPDPDKTQEYEDCYDQAHNQNMMKDFGFCHDNNDDTVEGNFEIPDNLLSDQAIAPDCKLSGAHRPASDANLSDLLTKNELMKSEHDRFLKKHSETVKHLDKLAMQSKCKVSEETMIEKIQKTYYPYRYEGQYKGIPENKPIAKQLKGRRQNKFSAYKSKKKVDLKPTKQDISVNFSGDNLDVSLGSLNLDDTYKSETIKPYKSEVENKVSMGSGLIPKDLGNVKDQDSQNQKKKDRKHKK